MSDPLSPLDFKFLPDWLKESAPSNPYAGFQGDSGDAKDDRHRGGGRREGGRSSRFPQSREGEGRRYQRSGRPQRDSRGSSDRHGKKHGHNDAFRGERRESRPIAESAPVNLRIEFLPEPTGAANISKQIRQSGRAYPLFNTARLFLEKPERHLVRITSNDASRPLYQIGDSHICLDRSFLERFAFRDFRSDYYREEITDIEPPKGNYTNVARCRSTGLLLGPTSYHGYQPAIRKLYEERFSRRMSFVQFQREEIETVSGEQAVADWKSQLSKQTTYHTTQEPEPLIFNSLQDAESHFKKTYLPTLIKSGASLQCSGKIARELPERGVTRAIREAFDRELAYPSSLVNGLRQFLADQNLQVFKHRKRVLFLSSVRPKRAESSQEFSDGPASILKTIEEHPRINRRELALRILGKEEAESQEPSERKKQLASDLHYLVHAGFVIEFSDGHLDLPLSPNAPTPSPSDPEHDTDPESASTSQSGEPSDSPQTSPHPSDSEPLDQPPLDQHEEDAMQATTGEDPHSEPPSVLPSLPTPTPEATSVLPDPVAIEAHSDAPTSKDGEKDHLPTPSF